MEQLRALARVTLVIIWFKAISWLGSQLVLLWSKEPATFIEKHGHLLDIMCFITIFLGIYAFDAFKKEWWQNLIPKNGKEMILFTLMGIGSYFLTIMITSVLIPFFPQYMEITEQFNEYEPILRFCAIVILPPIVEEYLFRYKIQGYLEIGFGKTIAIIGQALLFGGLHYYTLQKIYACLMGILLGYVKEKKGIRATVWMHGTINFIGWTIGMFTV